MPKDACYKKVKASYDAFPSARASQAIAKCRKNRGNVRKDPDQALRRWAEEKWKDVRTGKPCGEKSKGKQYCRPTRKVSEKTPKTGGSLSPAEKRKAVAAKKAGKRAPTLKKT